MARPIRIEYPSACYHITNKSEEGQRLFPNDKYYEAFLEGVRQAAARFHVDIISWCLLRNEYHLLIRTPEGNLSRFMRQVDGLYTQNYQKLRRRNGSVFRARYKSVLVQAEEYLSRVSAYIHNLPKQARQNPLDWQWSSLSVYLNNGAKEAGLTVDPVLNEFGRGVAARRAYGEYVEGFSDRELCRFYGKKNQLSVLGDEKFRDRARKIALLSSQRTSGQQTSSRSRPSTTKIVNSVADTFKVSDNSILKAARGPGSKNVPRWVAMYLCQEAGGITLQQIASQFGLQRYGTVSTTIGKLKEEFADNPPLENRVKRMRMQLCQ